MRKIIVSILTVIFTFAIGLLVACEPEGSGEATLTMNKAETTVVVEKYDNAWLIAEYTGDKELVWVSENPAVATVELGKITGVGVGTTKISVSDGKLTQSCSVTVTEADVEKLALSAEEKMTVYLGDQTALKAMVTYNNIPVDSATISYATESANITVDGTGMMTATALGEGNVTVSATVEGKELSKTVAVNVMSVYAVNIEQKDVVLYPEAEYDGKSYYKTIACDAVVTNRGSEIDVEKTDIVWSVPQDQDVISVDENGLVTALNGGVATLTASYAVGGETVSGEMTVTVATIDTKVENVLLNIGLVSKFIPDLQALVGSDAEVGKIVVDAAGVEGVEVFPEDGAFDMSQFSSGSATVALVTRNYSYTFDADICDGVIASVEDMKLLLTATQGTYKLIADIDMSGYTDNGGKWVSSAIFEGTIDGMGHTVSNFKTSTGLFAQFNGGALKNISFTNVITEGACGVLSAGLNRSASKAIVIDNVYVHVTAGNGWYIGLMGNVNLKDTFTMKNSVMIGDVQFVAVLGRVGSRAITMINCHLVNVKGYVASLNNNLDAAAQQALHLPATNTATSHLNAESAYISYLNGDMQMTEMVEKFFVADMAPLAAKVKTVTSENVADLLTATDGIFLLQEDIDMSTAYTANGGVWTSTTSFNGMLVGNGHTISGFKTNTGLFKNFNGGSIVDVAFTGVQTQGNIGVFGSYDRGKGKAILLENVLVEISSRTADWYVGLLGMANLIEHITMNSCVVICDFADTAKGAIVGRIGSMAIKMTNCYLVNTKGYVASLNTALSEEKQKELHLPATNTVSSYANKAAFMDAYRANSVKGLAEFIRTILDGWNS